ncbi:response regulator transcription factor [[Pseudomonas] boreopolis]|uniref:response regulator transcription factor n=1 Tax=Xanthomonas boreopolis TaxID=86183 RepID=UPI003D9AC25A
MNRIALVEDHLRLAELIGRGLEPAGIGADVYGSVQAAWSGIAERDYAAIVVDRGLPDGDGLALVRRLRAAGSRVPCLVLTSRDALRDRVDGLEAGADDYLPKPFALEELVARVRALMRRAPVLRDLQPCHADLRVLPEAGCMSCGEESVTLSTSELQIIICLVRAEGGIVRHATLEAAAWGRGEGVTPNALEVALHRLRRKLAAIGSELSIRNIRGHGFALYRTHVAP